MVIIYYNDFCSGKDGDLGTVKEHFPFTKFFENAPQPVFKGRTYAEEMDIAEGCFRHIKSIFKQLEEFHAFELLRSGSDRFVVFIYPDSCSRVHHYWSIQTQPYG